MGNLWLNIRFWCIHLTRERDCRWGWRLSYNPVHLRLEQGWFAVYDAPWKE